LPRQPPPSPRPSRAARASRPAPPPPPPEDEYLKLENQICFPLYAAARLMVSAYRPLLADFDITYPQYLVLLVLWENDGLSVGEIGERLLLDSGTLTPVLKRLQTQGLVERSRNAGDDRIVENRLTAKARDMKKNAVRVPIDLVCRSGMGMEELDRLRKTLHELIVTLQKMQGPPAPPSLEHE
jgi:MarR family transcriptional regulator, organic hydroperoxide resistance regulator